MTAKQVKRMMEENQNDCNKIINELINSDILFVVYYINNYRSISFSINTVVKSILIEFYKDFKNDDNSYIFSKKLQKIKNINELFYFYNNVLKILKIYNEI